MLFYQLLLLCSIYLISSISAEYLPTSAIDPASKRTIDRARFAIHTIYPDKSTRPKFHVTRASQQEVFGYKFWFELQIILQGDKCYFKDVGVLEKNDNTGLYLIENTDHLDLPCILSPRNYNGDLFTYTGYFYNYFF